MHPVILGGGLWAAALASAASGQSGGCDPQALAMPPVLERFAAADCSACWQQPAHNARPAGPAWVIDWIVPTQADAPMAAAALPEAAERLARLARSTRLGSLPTPLVPAAGSAQPSTGTGTGTGTGPDGRRAEWFHQPAPPPAGAPGMQVGAQAGPAWLGRQMALEFSLHARALPPGAVGWLAMVEHLPAGSEGSPIERWLLRNLAGPLPLDSWQPQQRLSHLRAMRWPEGADASRLQARAWVETAEGQLLAVDTAACPPSGPSDAPAAGR